MGEAYKAKVFRSGNSVALRLPKALGLTEGMQMTVREERGSFIVEPLDAPKRTIRGEWIGGMPSLQPLAPEDRLLEGRDLDWTGAKLQHG